MEKIRFDNFVSLNRGFDLPDDKIIEGKYPVIASTSIKAYHNQFKVKAPIVVTGRSGSLGKVQYVDEDGWPLNTALYAKDFHGNNPKYVYYFLQTMHLEQYNAGAGVPTLNQNHLHSLKILIHELPTQQKIASILSAYDNLIQNYKKQIEALQTAASELYKEWFVRFRFPGYQTTEFENGIPKGWKVEKVKNCVNRLPFGQTYKKDELEPEGNVIVIDQSEDEYLGYHNNEPSHTASPENPIALFGDHSCKYKLMIKDFSLGENIIPYISKGVDLYYLYYSVYKIVQTEEYKRHWNLFVNKKILIPNTELQKSFRQKVIPIFKQIEILNKQIANLTQQRDLLLPRLMSGKLEVK